MIPRQEAAQIIRSRAVRPSPGLEKLVAQIETLPEIRGWADAVNALHELADLHAAADAPLLEWDRNSIQDRRAQLVKLHDGIGLLRMYADREKVFITLVDQWRGMEGIPDSYQKDLETIMKSYWPEFATSDR